MILSAVLSIVNEFTVTKFTSMYIGELRVLFFAHCVRIPLASHQRGSDIGNQADLVDDHQIGRVLPGGCSLISTVM
jgi:hypothetical protein